MLFSATLDGDVGHLIRHYLPDPVEVAVDSATDTVGTMHHLFLAVHHMDKDRVVGAIGQGIPKVARVLPDEAAVRQGRPLARGLGVDVAAIHGDLPQSSRERALRRFAEGKLPCSSPPTSPPVASTSTTSVRSSTTSPPRTPRTTCTARAAPPAGRDGWAITLVEYNQHTQMRILQRTLRLPLEPAIEVFSNNPTARPGVVRRPTDGVTRRGGASRAAACLSCAASPACGHGGSDTLAPTAAPTCDSLNGRAPTRPGRRSGPAGFVAITATRRTVSLDAGTDLDL